ncbi:endospore germination permease [Clostridium sp. SHJSY1]|uniref:endospore germination permease n=1 Tax=Clostridium sp. SHJSY1 TaxID=2942483 RepID=UPI002874B083|nr:endospore germination permease [Clostridium sp. SHJSY1]MDS0525575.1 endospore germination permease [Clostridium sp. SHJSY1]
MNKISTKHFMFFIIATSTIALRTYSSVFINYGGRDTWIISVIASTIIFFYFSFLIKTCNTTNTYDFDTITCNSTSTFIGSCLKLMFSLGLFLSALESCSVVSSSIHTNYFLDTPTWYCLLFIIIPAGYVISKSLNPIIILTIITITLVLVGDLILMLLVSKYLNFNYLLPLFNSGFSYSKWICLLLIIGSLSSISITLPYLRYLDKKASLLKHSKIAIVFCTIIITFSFLSAIAFFGPEMALNFFYPEFVAAQRVQIASFLEFGELFYIFRSVCMWFIKYILSSYGIIILYKDKIKDKKLFIFFYSLIMFTVSFIFTENQYFLFSSLKLLQIINIFIFIFIPIISFLIFCFKHKKDIGKVK